LQLRLDIAGTPPLLARPTSIVAYARVDLTPSHSSLILHSLTLA
jgi:hypothetical protein